MLRIALNDAQGAAHQQGIDVLLPAALRSVTRDVIKDTYLAAARTPVGGRRTLEIITAGRTHPVCHNPIPPDISQTRLVKAETTLVRSRMRKKVGMNNQRIACQSGFETRPCKQAAFIKAPGPDLIVVFRATGRMIM